MPLDGPIFLDQRGPLVWLTWNRSDRLNAMRPQLVEELSAAQALVLDEVVHERTLGRASTQNHLAAGVDPR